MCQSTLGFTYSFTYTYSCAYSEPCELPSVGRGGEVKYLYVAGENGSLYQPVYLGERDEIDADDCTLERQHLKYKPAA